ncbi:hypothetical protein HU200_021868 [Digitaria exilis]|uniref:Uncharacterized protein n=1 Tax=Digitaria exilis TaxID=1010633 RepID=A0A835K8S2_9POAL|nr:hypothetical protein HU200_021868 [Digitaria exilis]
MGDVSLNPQPFISDEPLTMPASAAKQDHQIRDLMSSGWTNERHSSYISSMEASFVDQLYGIQNHGLDANKKNLGDNGFKVFQEGVCKNVRFQRNQPHTRDAGINYLPENPWVTRFRPRSPGASRRDVCVEAMADDYGSGTDTVREKVRTHGREVKTCSRQNLIGKSKEVSDQNFPDEEIEASNELCKKQKSTSSSAASKDPGT